MNRIEQLKEFLKDTPEDPFLHYALTMEYLKQEDHSNAQLGFEQMVSTYPSYVGTYYHFGKFLEKLDEKERAENIYNEGIVVARNARNMHAMGELQGALQMLKGFDEDDDEY